MDLGQGVPPLLLAMLLLSAGCLDLGRDARDQANDPNLLPTTKTENAHLTLSVATPERTFSQGENVVFTISEHTTGVVLEYEWSPTEASNQEGTAWVDRAGAGAFADDPSQVVMRTPPVAKQSGPSPIRIALSVDDLGGPGEYQTILRALEPAGLMVEQPWRVHISIFNGIPFDPDHSSLEYPGPDRS